MEDVKKKILIVEDEGAYAEMVKLRLELAGYRCTIAMDTLQAVREASNRSYDLIVLDLMIPGGGGFAFLGEIRKKSSIAEIPVVILTGKSVSTEDKALIAAYDIAALFGKPYDPEKFINTIDGLIRQ
jgi:two-component system phosphate regulon response regulator PhoB